MYLQRLRLSLTIDDNNSHRADNLIGHERQTKRLPFVLFINCSLSVKMNFAIASLREGGGPRSGGRSLRDNEAKFVSP